MEITKTTMLKDILAAYPRLKERLPEINPKFKRLSGPVGKIMLCKADVAGMSEKSGMTADALIHDLNKLIGELG